MLGVLAAPSLILSKRPDAKQMLDKITPYQGWIGAISALWGVWGIISSVLSLSILADWPIYWITFLASSVLQAALGLLLGVGVLKTFIKNPQAQEKMDTMIAKLAPKQGLLGLLGICMGVWLVVSDILFHG
ncbi:MAG TPA: hypothetical protein VG389_24565 [Myxococcota bacterium]|nr:hypothetical protein [Myxococcota bacterium]